MEDVSTSHLSPNYIFDIVHGLFFKDSLPVDVGLVRLGCVASVNSPSAISN